MTRIAIITTELPAFLAAPTAGGGTRVWGIGSGLVERGHQVDYFVLESVLGNLSGETLHPYLPETLEQQLSQTQVDIALFEQWQPLAFLMKRLDIPTIVDLPGPLLLEYLWREPDAINRHIVEKIHCLSLADAFLIATPRQEHYYIPWLLLAGVDLTKTRPILCPFGLPLLPKCRQGVVIDEPRFFFGGVFWPWQNPAPYLRTVLERMNRVRRGQLVIVGGPHPYHAQPSAQKSLQDILDNPHSSFLGTLPFSEFVNEIRHATVALDLGFPTVERELACPLRTGTALWCGTPVMICSHSIWAESVSKKNAGWVVENAADPAFIETIDAILGGSIDFKIKSTGARMLTESDLDATRNVAALDQYIHNPVRRAEQPTRLDSRSAEREEILRSLERELDTLRYKRDRLQSDLDSIRSNPLFRVYKTIRNLF
ncbi:MAG: hypothetical protein ABIH23_02300 [bacterium]